jgi:hypothetical protein
MSGIHLWRYSLRPPTQSRYEEQDLDLLLDDLTRGRRERVTYEDRLRRGTLALSPTISRTYRGRQSHMLFVLFVSLIG